ncbi:MAG: S41 family peptidase [Gemmatimonadota bacterium]
MMRLSIRALLLPILAVTVLGPVTPLGAQQTARPFGGADADDPSELGAEAEVFLRTLEAIRDYGLEPQPDSALWEKAIDGLVRELGDPYATVLSREEVEAFEEQSTGNYAGIGIAISELNGAVTVTTVFPGTPADRAGLIVGDRIVGVGSEFAPDSVGGWNTNDASGRIRGLPGTTVVVHVERDGFPRPIPHEIRREEVHIPAVRAERIFENTGYVLLDRVTRSSAAEVDSVLTELEGVDGLILDLRQNPGGYLDESLNLADLFLDRGSVLVTTRSRTRGDGEVREESARARMAPRVEDIPIVVLVDRFSASAAEIIAGALQDHDRALVIGERTFGKGTVQSVVPLPEGRLIRITSGEWYTPQGRSLNRARDLEGNLLDVDSTQPTPRFRSAGGRTILGGGGVFPDLEVGNDTLSAAEQRFMTATVDAEIPLTTRIQEAALDAGQAMRDSGALESEDLVDVRLPEGTVDTFVAALVEGGLGEELVTEETREYLRWRLEMAFYSRLQLERNALEVRSQRDTVLRTALRLLNAASDQAELFSLATEEQNELNATQARATGADGSSGALQPN